MSTAKYPNRDAIRDANDIYLDVMRKFIFHHLRQVKGESVKSLIEEALPVNQVDQFLNMLDSHSDVESSIDFNHIPQIIKFHWNLCFGNILGWDLVVQSRLWLIREGRNSGEHRGSKDIELELTRTHLFLIASVFEKINRLDKKEDIETILNNCVSNKYTSEIEIITTKLTTEESEKKKYKREFEKAKTETEELNNELVEAHKEKEDWENKYNSEKEKLKKKSTELTTVKKQKKESDEKYKKFERELNGKLNEIKQEKNTIASNLEYKEKENFEYKARIQTLENQLTEIENEKRDKEKLLNSMNDLFGISIIDSHMSNWIYPKFNENSSNRILDHRNTDKETYLFQLLEQEQGILIYVQDQDRIDQFMEIIGPEMSDNIGKHTNQTTDEEETELFEKLEKGELIAIVSDTSISDSTKFQSVQHFIFCHLCLDEDVLIARCRPAFTSEHNTYLHLIYDDEKKRLDKLIQKYPDRKTLEVYYLKMRDHIGINGDPVDLEEIYKHLDGIKREFEISCDIFEELKYIKKNDSSISLLEPSGRKLDESEIYCNGMKHKEKLIELKEIQLNPSVESIWNKIVGKLDNNKEQNNSSEDDNDSEQTAETENEEISTRSPTTQPEKKRIYLQALRMRLNKNYLYIDRSHQYEFLVDGSHGNRDENSSSQKNERYTTILQRNGSGSFLSTEKNEEYKRKYNLAMKFFEVNGILALIENTIDLIQDRNDPNYDFTDDNSEMLNACTDALKDSQKTSRV